MVGTSNKSIPKMAIDFPFNMIISYFFLQYDAPSPLPGTMNSASTEKDLGKKGDLGVAQPKKNNLFWFGYDVQ